MVSAGILSKSGSQNKEMAVAGAILVGLKNKKYEVVPLENPCRIGSDFMAQYAFLKEVKIIRHFFLHPLLLSTGRSWCSNNLFLGSPVVP